MKKLQLQKILLAFLLLATPALAQDKFGPDGDRGDATVSDSGQTITIDNGVITGPKIANNACGSLKIPSDAIGSNHIAANMVNPEHLFSSNEKYVGAVPEYSGDVLGLPIFTWVDGPVTPSEPMFLNVKDFGALGDGTTDDTTAIQDALSSMGESCAAGLAHTVYFPPGTYKVSSTINVPACMRALGSNRTSAVIAASSTFPTTSPVVSLCNDSNPFTGQGCLLQDIAVTGGGRATNCMYTEQAQEGAGVDGFYCSGFTQKGIFVENSAAGPLQPVNYIIRDVEMIAPATCASTVVGIEIDAGAGGPLVMENMSIVGCDTSDSGATCIRLEGGGDQNSYVVNGVHCELNGNAIYDAAPRVTMMGVTHIGTSANPTIDMESNNSVALSIDSNNPSVTLHDGTYGYDTGAGGIGFYAQALGIGQVVKTGNVNAPGTCGTGGKGAIYFDTTLSELCFCDGTNWKTIDGTGGTPGSTDCH